MLDALERLAAPAPEQIRYLNTHQVDSDELALEHREGVLMLEQFIEQGLLTSHQAALVHAVDRKLDEMSGAHQSNLWDDEALETSPEWLEVRRLASAAMSGLLVGRR